MSEYAKLLKERLRKEEGYIFFKRRYKYKIALVFPNTYFIGMSNLGFQLVYIMLNSYEDIYCERFFLPDKKDWDIRSIETQTPIEGYDLILFSVQTEFDYMNIIDILKRGNLKPLKEERRKPVLAGGIAVSYNPHVLSPFLDGFFLGEAETGIIEHLYKALEFLENKEVFLSFLSQNRHIYIPSIDEPQTKIVGRVKELASETHTHIFSEETVFGDMFLIELARGCEARCRFCIAGSFVKPFRPKPVNLVRKSLEWGVKFRKKAGFIGADVSNYPWLEEIKDIVEFYKIDTSFSSLRPIIENTALLDIIKISSQKTVTIAPETGTDKLRFLINKTHTNEEYISFCEKLIKYCGVKNIKLYFLIGLPHEEIEDLEGIVDLCEKIASIKGLYSLTLSVNHVVPKPFTPFQRYKIDPEKIYWNMERFEKIIKKSKLFNKAKIELEKPENTIIEYALSVGNEVIGLKLFEVYSRYGNNKRKLLKHMGFKDIDITPTKIDPGIKTSYINAHWNSLIYQKPAWGDCKDGCKICELCNPPYVSSKSLKLRNSILNKVN